MAKGKIYKHCGNATGLNFCFSTSLIFGHIWVRLCSYFAEAAALLDTARSLDTADRFVNCKCVKYQFRAGLIKEAEANASFFTKVCFVPAAKDFLRSKILVFLG
jgi:hypothetical protein